MTPDRVRSGQFSFATLVPALPSCDFPSCPPETVSFDRNKTLLRSILAYKLQTARPPGVGLYVDLDLDFCPVTIQAEDGDQTIFCPPEVIFNPSRLRIDSKSPGKKVALAVLVSRSSLFVDGQPSPILLPYLGRVKKNGGGFFVVELLDCQPPTPPELIARRSWLRGLGLTELGVSLRHSSFERFSQAVIWRGRRPLTPSHPARSMVGSRAEFTVKKGLGEVLDQLCAAGWRTIDDREFREKFAVSHNLPDDARRLADGNGRVVGHTCGCLYHVALNGITTQLYQCNHESSHCGCEPDMDFKDALPVVETWRPQNAFDWDRLQERMERANWHFGCEGVKWQYLKNRAIIEPASSYWGEQISWESLKIGDTVKTACGCGGVAINALQPSFDQQGKKSFQSQTIVLLLRVAPNCQHHHY